MKKQNFTFLLLMLFIAAVKGQEVSSLATIKNTVYQKEINVAAIKLGNEAKIIWSQQYKEKQSPIAFVYLHGFGASSREG
jgi:hypothetical protein